METRRVVKLIDLGKCEIPNSATSCSEPRFSFTKELLPKLPELIAQAKQREDDLLVLCSCSVEDELWKTARATISHDTVRALQAAGYDPRRAHMVEEIRETENSDWRPREKRLGKLAIVVE